MDLHSNTELIRFAIKDGLVKPLVLNVGFMREPTVGVLLGSTLRRTSGTTTRKAPLLRCPSY